MTCSFEEIAESEEEEDVQFPERPQPQGRSLFAVQLPSPYARGRRNSLQNFSPLYVRKVVRPRLCRGISDPEIRRRTSSITLRGSLSPDRHGADFLTLPPIPESVGSSSS
ncbi:hypothetical protein OESDEN_22700 [Oesophagostomum dentatum]|uniref:Uncharacterized protein n=1 Tax=Oesophagostomum dentatum TaxID=61180 RepID=A0A0B1S3B7_OESDE|nr:hypothetical protein OESDEN_22700 [Oesophagostomum dentatum]